MTEALKIIESKVQEYITPYLPDRARKNAY